MISAPTTRSCFLALTMLTASATAGETIEWQRSADAALARAKADNLAVMMSVSLDGDQFSEELLKEHYRNEVILQLVSRTVNLFASAGAHGRGSGDCRRTAGLTCAEHRAVLEFATRKFASKARADRGRKQRRNRKNEPDEAKAPVKPAVVAPQHIFLDSGGEILFSAPYDITVGELEWCLVEAIRRVDPQFPWTLSNTARAPRRISEKSVSSLPAQPRSAPPSRQEFEEAMDRLHKTGRGEWDRDARDDVAVLVACDEKKAMSFVKSMLSLKRNANQKARYTMPELLHLIGKTAPRSWWTVVEPYVDDHRESVRIEAAVALEQLGEPRALGKLMKQWKKEDEVNIRNELIRAVAAVDPDSKSVIRLVCDYALKGKDESTRASAVVAAADLEDRQAVQQLARELLNDELPAMRGMAAWLIGVRRARELRPALEEAMGRETNGTARDAMDAAIEALTVGKTGRLNSLAREYTASKIKRDRL